MQAVHQHDLAIETHKVLFIKRLDDRLAIIVKTGAQHARIGMFVRLCQARFPCRIDVRPREKLQRRRTGHITRQHKAPRLNKVQPFSLTAQQVVGISLGDRRQLVFIRRGQRIEIFAQC
ncbi:hypothetical protein D3C78_1526260 [compost metagenome]